MPADSVAEAVGKPRVSLSEAPPRSESAGPWVRQVVERVVLPAQPAVAGIPVALEALAAPFDLPDAQAPEVAAWAERRLA